MSVTQRRITDATEMRALAHPLRIRLLELLGAEGAFTASAAARRLDETPANVSWHLRKLASYGFVRQGTGPGRERPWKLVAQALAFGADAEDPAAVTALSDLFLEREFQVLRASLSQSDADSAPWRDARLVLQSRLWLTAEEAAAVAEQLTRLLTDPELVARNQDPSRRPDTARLMASMGWLVPARPEAETAAGRSADASSPESAPAEHVR